MISPAVIANAIMFSISMTVVAMLIYKILSRKFEFKVKNQRMFDKLKALNDLVDADNTTAISVTILIRDGYKMSIDGWNVVEDNSTVRR